MIDLDSVYVQCYTRKEKDLATLIFKINSSSNVVITYDGNKVFRDTFGTKDIISLEYLIFQDPNCPDWATDVRWSNYNGYFYYTDGSTTAIIIDSNGTTSTYQNINNWEIIATKTEPKWEPDCSVGDKDFKILYEGKEISAYVDENGTEYFDYNENIQPLRTEREKLVHFIKSVIVPEPDEKLLYKLYDLGMLKIKED